MIHKIIIAIFASFDKIFFATTDPKKWKGTGAIRFLGIRLQGFSISPKCQKPNA